MKLWRAIVLVAPLGVALSAAPGLAHGRHQGEACRQDVEKLCPNLPPGPGSFHACIEQHASELSPACQQHLSAMKARMDQVLQTCQGDVQQFCGSVDPSNGGVFHCLHEHRDQLSQACRDQLHNRHHHRHHCPTPTPGSGA